MRPETSNRAWPDGVPTTAGDGDVLVGHCMHAGIVSCAPRTPLADVARMMRDYRVHAIAVPDLGHGRPWGMWRIASDMDLMSAIATGHRPTACEMAGTEAATISADELLVHAAKMMSEQSVAHLVVLDAAAGYPVGIISTLDVASGYGTGQRAAVRVQTGLPQDLDEGHPGVDRGDDDGGYE
jgi:CBS domain-containing protein